MELEEEMQTELELKNAAIDKMERQLRQKDQQLEHNREELNAMRRITAKTLHAAGQTTSQIATTLGISIDEAEALIGA